MRVLIVENDEQDRKSLEHALEEFKRMKNYSFDVVQEEHPDTILEHLDEYDIIFLDIELDGMNGIILGKQIRKANKDIRLVFVSAYNKYLVDGYKARADLYILKPIEISEFYRDLEDLFQDYLYHSAGFMNTKISKKKLYFHEMMYIEMMLRKSNIYLLDGEQIDCYYPLNKWMEILKEAPFAQPHRSFLVNLEHIVRYKPKEIEMVNGERIPITDVFRKEFERSYVRYLNRRV